MQINIDNNIILRQLEKSDAPYIFHIIDSQREYLGKWLPFVEFTKAIEDSEAFVNSVTEAVDKTLDYVFSIRKHNSFIGLIGFKGTDKLNKKTEIGYWIAKNYQKQGIITRSVIRLCDFAFNNLGMNRVQIKCAIGNMPSNNIPKRLGFKFEGIERGGELLTGGVFTDLAVYSKLKND
jgi:ribosomal-protein-serine acetyltransferase